VSVGQQVTKGTVLATADSTAAQLALTSAQATLASAQSKLTTDQSGPDAISLAQAKNSLSQAWNSYEQAVANQQNTAAQNALALQQAQDAPRRRVDAGLAAFGSTRRAGVKAAQDPQLQALLESGMPVLTIVGKTWRLHVTEILGTTLEENLAMIGDSVRFFKEHGKEVVYDAEHFFEDRPVNHRQAELFELRRNFWKSQKPLRLGRHWGPYFYSTTLLHSCAL